MKTLALSACVIALLCCTVPARAAPPTYAEVAYRDRAMHMYDKRPVREIGYGQVRYRGLGPEAWHWRYVQARRRARLRFAPTVTYALRRASAVYGVPFWQLHRVAWCESRLDVWAVNGRYKGILQLGWRPFGFSPFDPVASALSTASTVRREGSWRRWECGRGLR
jgi:hypothetical protein